MKRLAYLSLLLALLVSPAFAAPEATADRCATGYSNFTAKTAVAELDPRVDISAAQFDEITDRLRKTLSGNLATVLRSEWKAKGSVGEANKYIQDLVNDFLTPETRALVTKGLNAKDEGYIRTVAKRLFDLAESDKKLVAEGKPPVLKPADFLGVRDPAPPAGARDLTFTYYTRAVGDDAGGKHQIRVRNYLRLVSLNDMKPNVPVTTFDRNGAPLKLVRDPAGHYELTAGAGAKETKRTLNAAEVKAELGEHPVLYAAPHGGKFKLEVKTRLKDSVSPEKYPLLGGQNLVQKLDVSLSMKQVKALFGPLPAEREAALAEGRARLAKVKEEILAGIEAKEKKAFELPEGNPERKTALAETAAGRERVGAVLHMLGTAVEADPNFLRMEGATLYSRSAFEIAVPDRMAGKSVKLQTTVDRDLGAFRGVYDAQGNLLDPVDTYRERPLLNPASEREQRHWELKVPQPLVAKEAGLRTGGEGLAGIEVDPGPASPELRRAMEAFSFCNVTNRGKFVHICSQADVDDRKPAVR